MRARSLAILLLTALLAACFHAPPRNPMAQWVPSPNHEPRRPILIVLHATEQDGVQESLDTLRTGNSGGPVSAHYLLGRDGGLYQLVSDDLRAWHAGPGRWGTITDVNSVSIGIELDNDGESPFPPEQIAGLLRLLDDLCERHGIPRTQIVAHADFAPTRKRDPGRLFPWKQLADAGFGRWPDADAGDPPAGFDPWLALQLVGYPLDDRAATVRAFHRHFRGIETDVLDDEDLRILHALTRMPRDSAQ
ncbi:N-acetylmuramoyl-L-alanine amidase [Luteimonas sp. SX5]|uniref:N-acetylmuramoyl-L-alanine amidase n=1 Tax=Luteimonas galliterrae TaxID=2940486 RepID=A0ABT0MMK3_9GAMM|nr:N-acetylmuramoyl-L-alanine amidase [Luteimonas galliterrae]MCL1635833.1 N-acetylmuramoyl-L-alanine amidase [Luteimonas galliterrae]